MSDAFGIDLSALQALQQAIAVTSNNVANAGTPGYNVESTNFLSAAPQLTGGVAIGDGVRVAGVSRAFSQTATGQLYASQSSLGQLDALQTYTTRIDNLFGTTVSGLSTALQNFYNGWSQVANNPTSAAARQALLGDAQALASNLNTTSGQLDSLNGDVNSRIAADVQQINSIASSIGSLNQQIVNSSASGPGQAPNTLLDQRDQLVSNLSKLVGVSTTTDGNGALNVFIGNGQPLVLQGVTSTLSTVRNVFNPSQLEIASSSSSGAAISGQLSSGDLGGLLAARTQAINPALNQLGQIATAVASSANYQQNQGLNLNGQLGANLFSLSAPTATASSRNTDNAKATVGIANLGALTSDNYLLAYGAAGYTLTDQTTGASVPLSGAGTAASPLTAAGLSIVLSATPAQGDQFLIQPTAQAAGSISVALTDPAGIAAAGAVRSAAANTNTGNATIGSPTVANAANPNLLATTTLQFSSPTTYSVNGAGSFAYVSGGTLSINGWQTTISGTPAAGDVFTVQSNAGGTGDNTNALAAAARQTQGILSNGATSINGAVGALIAAIGGQAQQVNTAQTAQTAVNSQTQAAVQSISGVNLDEEAAHLVQWQQAYQASAQAMNIANGLFADLLNAIK